MCGRRVLIEDVFGWSRGDPGLKPSCDSETGTDLILLKEPGHGGTGVPVSQETQEVHVPKCADAFDPCVSEQRHVKNNSLT